MNKKRIAALIILMFCFAGSLTGCFQKAMTTQTVELKDVVYSEEILDYDSCKPLTLEFSISRQELQNICELSPGHIVRATTVLEMIASNGDHSHRVEETNAFMGLGNFLGEDERIKWSFDIPNLLSNAEYNVKFCLEITVHGHYTAKAMRKMTITTK